MHYGTAEEQPAVIRTTALIYPVTIQERLPDNRHHQGYAEVNWSPIEMIDLERFKVAVISFGMNSPFVKQMLN